MAPELPRPSVTDSFIRSSAMARKMARGWVSAWCRRSSTTTTGRSRQNAGRAGPCSGFFCRPRAIRSRSRQVGKRCTQQRSAGTQPVVQADKNEPRTGNGIERGSLPIAGGRGCMKRQSIRMLSRFVVVVCVAMPGEMLLAQAAGNDNAGAPASEAQAADHEGMASEMKQLRAMIEELRQENQTSRAEMRQLREELQKTQ